MTKHFKYFISLDKCDEYILCGNWQRINNRFSRDAGWHIFLDFVNFFLTSQLFESSCRYSRILKKLYKIAVLEKLHNMCNMFMYFWKCPSRSIFMFLSNLVNILF